jgi:hypothetical protein
MNLAELEKEAEALRAAVNAQRVADAKPMLAKLKVRSPSSKFRAKTQL